MTPQIADEVLALLDEQSITHETVLEHSAGQEVWTEGVRVLGAAGRLASLGAVIIGFMRRHDGKKVVIARSGDGKTESAGYSEKAVERIPEQARRRTESA